MHTITYYIFVKRVLNKWQHANNNGVLIVGVLLGRHVGFLGKDRSATTSLFCISGGPLSNSAEFSIFLHTEPPSGNELVINLTDSHHLAQSNGNSMITYRKEGNH